jgi:hypothetical protein
MWRLLRMANSSWWSIKPGETGSFSISRNTATPSHSAPMAAFSPPIIAKMMAASLASNSQISAYE